MSLPGTDSGPRAWLELERECLGRLVAILDAERAAAAGWDAAALAACLKEREAVQAAWQRAATGRRTALAGAGVPLARLTAADPVLAALVADVRAQATAVRRAQRVNEGLIRAVLAHVSDLVSTVQRALPGSRYDGRAALTGPPPLPSTSWSV